MTVDTIRTRSTGVASSKNMLLKEGMMRYVIVIKGPDMHFLFSFFSHYFSGLGISI